MNFGFLFLPRFVQVVSKELRVVLRFELLRLHQKISKVMFEGLEFSNVEHSGDADLKRTGLFEPRRKAYFYLTIRHVGERLFQKAVDEFANECGVARIGLDSFLVHVPNRAVQQILVLDGHEKHVQDLALQFESRLVKRI